MPGSSILQRQWLLRECADSGVRASRARFRHHSQRCCGKVRQLQARSLCSPELKALCENYETSLETDQLADFFG